MWVEWCVVPCPWETLAGPLDIDDSTPPFMSVAQPSVTNHTTLCQPMKPRAALAVRCAVLCTAPTLLIPPLSSPVGQALVAACAVLACAAAEIDLEFCASVGVTNPQSMKCSACKKLSEMQQALQHCLKCCVDDVVEPATPQPFKYHSAVLQVCGAFATPIRPLLNPWRRHVPES